MPIDPFITGIIETGLNTLLKESFESKAVLHHLNNKVIHVHLNELNKDCYFLFSKQNIPNHQKSTHAEAKSFVDVLSNFEGEVDCYLALNLSALSQLREQENITQLIKQDQLVLEGDIRLAQHFSAFLSQLKPDIEELLSKYIGDVAAYTLVRGVTNGSHWIKSKVKQQLQYSAEVATEEWRFIPTALEIAYFCEEVTDIEKHAEQLDKRFKQLMEKV